MIRPADWDKDYWPLMTIGKTFLEESHQRDLDWDQDAAHAYFWELMQDPLSTVFVAQTGNDVVGYAIVRLTREYTVQHIAYLVSFYVLPDYRGELHSWRLLKACQEYAIDRDAAFLYAASTAGMDDEGKTLEAFARMFGKAGMTRLGEFFMQDLRNG